MENKIKIELKDIQLVKNLLELVEKYYSKLPIELQESIKQIEEVGLNNFTVEDLHKLYPNIEFNKVETSIDKVIYINKILKKICVIKDSEEYILYPDHFYLKYDNKMIIEW